MAACFRKVEEVPRKKKEVPLLRWDRPEVAERAPEQGCTEAPVPRKRGRPRKQVIPAVAWKPPTGEELRELEEDWDQAT